MTECHHQPAHQLSSRLPYWTSESPTAATARLSIWQKTKNILAKPLLVRLVGLVAIFMIVVFSQSTGPLPSQNSAMTRDLSSSDGKRMLMSDKDTKDRKCMGFDCGIDAKNCGQVDGCGKGEFCTRVRGQGGWSCYNQYGNFQELIQKCNAKKKAEDCSTQDCEWEESTNKCFAKKGW